MENFPPFSYLSSLSISTLVLVAFGFSVPVSSSFFRRFASAANLSLVLRIFDGLNVCASRNASSAFFAASRITRSRFSDNSFNRSCIGIPGEGEEAELVAFLAEARRNSS